MNLFSLSEGSASISPVAAFKSQRGLCYCSLQFHLLILYSFYRNVFSLSSMSHPAASGLHDTCCHQNETKTFACVPFLFAFHPNSGKTTPRVLWVSHSSSAQYNSWSYMETLCDKLFERKSHGSDNVHEPHLNPNPWSASWPAETSRQPENALLKHETKAASICPTLLGTEPTWRGFIWSRCVSASSLLLMLASLSAATQCLIWDERVFSSGCEWGTVRKIWVCFLFCGTGPQTHLKPTAQAKETVQKDILEDTGSVFVYVCELLHTSHVAVVEETGTVTSRFHQALHCMFQRSWLQLL